MEFFKLLFKRSKFFYISIALLGIINALLNIGLLLLINNAISGSHAFAFRQYEWAGFLLLVLFSAICSRVFQVQMIKLTTQINFDFELNILQKVQRAAYPDVVKLGNERIITAVNDVRTLVNLPEVSMNAINAAITMCCCFIYLFYISWAGALLIMGLMVSLLIFYLIRNRKIEKDLNEVRSLQNHYYRYLGDLLMGFKEIRTDVIRTRNIYSLFFLRNRSEARALTKKSSIRYATNELIGTYSWYIVIGVILFAIPLVVKTDAKLISAFLVTILYLIGPVAILVTLIPTYTNVRIALKRLTEFNRIINNQLPDNAWAEERMIQGQKEFSSISFHNVTYSYKDAKSDVSFGLGPLNLDIQKGEIVFIKGGNGSGKTTFVNILTGLYTPHTGSIYLNGALLPDGDSAAARQLIAAVFASPYLFTENYNDYDIRPENQFLQTLLRQLDLGEKARFENNTISPHLSKGQQKRLALIMALLEDKPVLVLDEWAADQDPAYRRFFYDQLLPELQRKGKTVIAITHDDQYYHCCNRLVRFDYGKVTEIQIIREEPLLQTI